MKLLKSLPMLVAVTGLLFGSATTTPTKNSTITTTHSQEDPFAQMDKIFEMQMRQMQMMRKQMDRLFRNFEQNFQTSTIKSMPLMINSSGVLSSGFKDKSDHYELKIKVGDLKNSKVDITTENGMLTIEVKKNKKIEKTNGQYGKIISYTNSSSVQSFTLPDDADSSKIEAKQSGNEIIITVPKKSKPKVIEIKKEENSTK